MAPREDSSPTDIVPPPSYQLSQEQFDRKTAHAIQLSSSIRQPIIDEDGWPIYDAATFEAVAESYGQSSSAGPQDADIPRHQSQASFPSLPPPPESMKVRSSYLPYSSSIPQKFNEFSLQTRSSDRRRRNHNADRDFPSEPREATPPPPFTPTGPSLDGPPFDEVVTMSYRAPDPPTQNRRASRSPVTHPIAPGRSQRFSDPQIQTQFQAPPPNPYDSFRRPPVQPDIPSRLIPSSTRTRVEFDPQLAYGRNSNNATVQGASSFYKQVNPTHHLLSILKRCV